MFYAWVVPLLALLWDRNALQAVEWLEDQIGVDMPVTKEFMPPVERRLRELLQPQGSNFTVEGMFHAAQRRLDDHFDIHYDDDDNKDFDKETNDLARALASMMLLIFLIAGSYFIVFTVLNLSVWVTFILPFLFGMIGLPQLQVVEWIVVGVLAVVYQSSVNARRPEFNGAGRTGQPDADFISGSFDCCSDCDYCCYGFFCAPCRYADTVSAVGVCPYSAMSGVLIGLPAFFGVVPVILMMISGPVIAEAWKKLMNGSMSQEKFITVCVTSSGIWVVPLQIIWDFALRAILICNRPKIRAALGKNPSCMCSDFCLWCFCPWCALCQEARDVDMETKTKIECCLKLKLDDTACVPLVGAAVNVELRAQDPRMAPPLMAPNGMPQYAGQVQYVQQGQMQQPLYAQAPQFAQGPGQQQFVQPQYAQGPGQPLVQPQYAQGPGMPTAQTAQLQYVQAPQQGVAPEQQVQYVQGTVMDVPPAAAQAMQQS